jgi:DNA-binding FadR family transcriptional regulator
LSVDGPVVREALKVLTTLGIVESRARSGTYVKSVQVTQSFAAGNWS